MDTTTPASDPRGAELLRAAFRDVHGPRLHGFALLLSLGDRNRAAAAASRAISAGMDRADELRHPERAAAWLRARVLREMRFAGGAGPQSIASRDAAMGDVGLAEPAADALAHLSIEQRAALISSAIEGLELGDVATVLDRGLSGTRRSIHAARAAYLAAATHWLHGTDVAALPGGELSRRVDEAATWAVGARHERVAQ